MPRPRRSRGGARGSPTIRAGSSDAAPGFKSARGGLSSRAGAGRRERGVAARMKVQILTGGAALPGYAHPGDSGLDLAAAERVVLEPGARAAVRTGIAIELPAGTEGQV